MDSLTCDILIIGASAGGVAAALAATEAGASVILLEASDWIGGQLTAQGVSTPDEQPHIETFGATRRYAEFRRRVRDYYRDNYHLTPEATAHPALNVGNCWVSKLSYEPRIGRRVLDRMLPSFALSEENDRAAQRTFRLMLRYEILEYRLNEQADTVLEVTAQDKAHPHSEPIAIVPQYVLDATDLGDVLAAVGKEGADWVTGAEARAETGEPDAPEEAKPHWVQPFTFPFALEWSPETASRNVIPPPHDYAELKELQQYHIKHGAITGLFEGKYPWWTYRRILAAANFLTASSVSPRKRALQYLRVQVHDNRRDEGVSADVAMINTAGNDFYGSNVIGAGAGDAEQIQATLQRAVRASRGYCYWLQTECPREETPHAPLQNPLTGEPFGYPEMRLVREIFDTKHGCASFPYIRESRRIVPRRRILEQEIVVKDFSGNVCRGDNARAAFMPDTVGIGHYALDIHPNGHGEPNHYVATRPFQIPLGALIPVRLKNLLPACKNLGTTHLTNGAYRLHPIEWAIGEASAFLAAFCLRHLLTPDAVLNDATHLRAFQAELLARGVPLHWYIDVPLDHPAFVAVQTLALSGIALGSETDLLFRPEEPIAPETWQEWRKLTPNITPETFAGTRAAAALLLIYNG